jgi:predicted NBD/HSP70 family sugar kinase
VVDGVGLAVPGLVDISHGVLQESPGGLTPGPVAVEIARLLARPGHGAARMFGIELDPGASLIAEIIGRIQIDNDSRCIGRHLLNTYPAERDFVSIYVGKGVGSAIVLDGRLYFGAHGFAGECGHQVVSLDGQIILPGLQRELHATTCACRKEGTHYESLVNDSGVVRLASSIDPELFAMMDAMLAPPSRSDLDCASLLEVTKSILVDEDSSPMTELVKSLAEAGRLYHFAATLRDRYAQLLTVGVANTVNTLDLGSVFMCGPLIESFDQLPGFREELEYWRKKYVFREGRVGIRVEHDAAHHAWMGAALLFRDAAYADAAGVRQSADGGRRWPIAARSAAAAS